MDPSPPPTAALPTSEQSSSPPRERNRKSLRLAGGVGGGEEEEEEEGEYQKDVSSAAAAERDVAKRKPCSPNRRIYLYVRTTGGGDRWGGAGRSLHFKVAHVHGTCCGTSDAEVKLE